MNGLIQRRIISLKMTACMGNMPTLPSFLQRKRWRYSLCS